jgi:hypothetical protein
MPFAYYSIADFGDARYERQWMQSVRSLRAHDPRTELHLVAYNGLSDALRREAGRRRVAVHDAGGYHERLRELAPREADALALYPALHKILSLRFLPAPPDAQVVYLDCDTFLFGPVAELCRRYRHRHFHAREEPWSRRSHYGYQFSYLDEDRLAASCRREGLAFVPPYNTGVFILNKGLAAALADSAGRFLHLAWRLMLGVAADACLSKDCNPALMRAARRVAQRPDAPPLPYPSSNWWILEEIAMLLTLGGVPAVTHGAFSRADVAQNGESDPARRPIVAHYYSCLEEEFFTRHARL